MLKADTLNEKQVKVLSLRMGADQGGELRTMEEVGKEMGVTRAYIHQIEASAYDALESAAQKKKAAHDKKWEKIA